MNWFVESAKVTTPRLWLRTIQQFCPVPNGRQLVVLGESDQEIIMTWRSNEVAAILRSGKFMWIIIRNSRKLLETVGDKKENGLVKRSNDGKNLFLGCVGGTLEA